MKIQPAFWDTLYFHFLKFQFECCGVDDWTDWPRYNVHFGSTTAGSDSWKDNSDDDDDDDDERSSSRKRKSKSNNKEEEKEYYETMANSDDDVPKVPESCCDPGKDQVCDKTVKI